MRASLFTFFVFLVLISFPSAQSTNPVKSANLSLARVDDGRLLAVLDLARGRAGSLESADNLLGLLVGDLAEDDVAAIEPLSLDGGDEELRAVAVGEIMSALRIEKRGLTIP